MSKLSEPENHGCAEDEEWNGEKCVKKQATEEQDEPKTQSVQPPEPEVHPCPEGEIWNEEKQACVKVSVDNFLGEIVHILNRKTTEQKRDFEALLSLADQNVTALREYNDILEKKRFPKYQNIVKRIAVLKESLENIEKHASKLRSEENQRLKETESVTTRLDNLEDKIKGQFKGRAKILTETKGEAYYEDPMKAVRYKAGKLGRK